MVEMVSVDVVTPWCGASDRKLYLQSGQFTSTVKTSEDVIGVDIDLSGISWDGTNTPWCGIADDKLYLQSGQFTSTVKTSEDVSGVDTGPTGISWDGTEAPAIIPQLRRHGVTPQRPPAQRHQPHPSILTW